MSCSILVSLKFKNGKGMALPRIGIVLAEVRQRTAVQAIVEAQGLSVNHCSDLAWESALRVAESDIDIWLTEEKNWAKNVSNSTDRQVRVVRINTDRPVESVPWQQAVGRELTA